MDKTTEDKMYLHIGSHLPLKYQEMNYPNRLLRCTHENDETKAKVKRPGVFYVNIGVV